MKTENKKSSLGVLENINSLDQEKKQSPYGIEWRKICQTIVEVRRLAEFSRHTSKKEDYTLTDSVLTLIESQLIKDRMGRAADDLDKIEQSAQKEQWSHEKIDTQLSLLRMSYLMTDQEFGEFARVRQLGKYGISRIPQPIVQIWENNIRGTFYHFTSFSINKKNDEAKIKLNPVYDGGIDSVAYPINEAEIILDKNKPIDAKLSISHWRKNNLDSEITMHPEIITYAKDFLSDVFTLNNKNNDDFKKARKNDGHGEDSTQLLSRLYDFIDSYLKRKLRGNIFEEFKKTIKYIGSKKVDSALGIKVLAEELLDNDAHLRKGYYAEKHPKVIEKTVELGRKVLEDIGCHFDGEVITNFYDIVQKAASDKRFAQLVENKYQSIFRGNINKENIPLEMIEDDMSHTISRYKFDIFTGAYSIALKKARGVDENKGTIIDL